jgi:hypothetical protein
MLSDIEGKFKLGCFGKSLPQAGVVTDRLLANRTHHRGKLAFELAEKFDGCKLIRFETRARTNWQYECAAAFLRGNLVTAAV